MNVTGNEDNCRKLREEDHVQIVSAEQKGYVQAHTNRRITENNSTDANIQTDNLLEEILYRDNMNKAFKRVKSNKGAGGIDGMGVEELLPYLKENGADLIRQIKEGKFKPNPVRRVEIPKEEKGKFRKLGIPTVVDRVVQQAITMKLTPVFEKQFSDNSFGFRPRRCQHDALRRCKEYADEGYVYVIDMDLEKFFDTVCQSKLIEILSKTIKDGRVISLIHKYLNSGVLENGVIVNTPEGVPQGGPLSPLLSNIMLNELDKELTRRGHKFVRYADDCMIFCKSRRSAERTLENIIPYIEKRLFLKVNRQKTVTAHISKVKYLGYGFYIHKGKCRFKVHKKSVAKLKNKIRELTKRNNGWSNQLRIKKFNEVMRGWINYFKMADMKNLMIETDEWARRKIRAVYWKQWKRVRTRYRMISKYGVPKWKVHEMANCRKGIWRASLMLNSVLTVKEIANLGYISLADYFMNVRVN